MPRSVPGLKAVVLAGGSGQRFWPLSRELNPKQLLAMFGTESLIAQAVHRILPFTGGGADITVVTNERLFDELRNHLTAQPDAELHRVRYILEPLARNTAPAIALAAATLAAEDPDAIMVVLPSDHMLEHVVEADAAGNVRVGRGVDIDSRDNIVYSTDHLVATLGVQDLIVVDTTDATLVLPKDRVQDVRAVVEALKVLGAPEVTQPKVSLRPWGSWTSLLQGSGYQIKLLEIKSGLKPSLQRHYHDGSRDAIVVIDADMQDPPKVILAMVSKWREGYHVVYGRRNRRPGESVFKLATAKVFYRLMRWLSDVDLPVGVGDFRHMDRAVVDVLNSMHGRARYVRGMVPWIGFEQTEPRYDRGPRAAGETKYTLRKMLRFAFDGVTSFSSRLLTLAANGGIVVTFLALVLAVFLVVERIIRPEVTVSGWTSTLVVVRFLGGVQLVSIGLLGAYMARVFEEVKGRPLYVVVERLGETARVSGSGAGRAQGGPADDAY